MASSAAIPSHSTARQTACMCLGVADYGVILFGAVMMFLVSLKGRSGSVRKQLAEKSVPVQVIVWFLLFFSILILGAYGVGYDSNQFIYNQF